MAQLAAGVVLRPVPERKVSSSYQPFMGVSLSLSVLRPLFVGTPYEPPTEGQVWPRGDFV